MNTLLTTDPEQAAKIIKRGGIVAFPTETVYGLGGNVFDEAAIAKIFEAKRRPADNPLIAHIAHAEQIGELAADVTGSAERLIEAFFPGPLTVVLRKAESVPLIATAGLDTIGIRMPRFELAHRFLSECGSPVAAPSANLSGKPSPTTWEAVREDLDGRIDCILQGRPSEIGLESTVVDCTGKIPLVLRSGSVTLEQLRDVIGETELYIAVGKEMPRSPGIKHLHYSPRARVMIAAGTETSSDNAAFIGTQAPSATFTFEMICKTVDEYAHSLFEFFRECDRRGIETIYCERVDETGIGVALMDRIRRSAAK